MRRLGRIKCMPYSGTKATLVSIVHWLRTDDEDETRWQAETDLAQQCLTEITKIMEMFEVVEMAAPISGPRDQSLADKLDRAIPEVRGMVNAIRNQDRTIALAHGESALRLL